MSSSFLMPLPLGKFDIAPEVMAWLQPKTELNIYNVKVPYSIVTVLYSVDATTSANATY
ncbi:MAG: hypothetical protein JST27_06840 [Bacteroidetes bacterium]|nr:hypothetical protein [Bacteroidota bacterium]